MNSTIILKKGEELAWWIYKKITNKFTSVYKVIKKRFPVFERYPSLKYSLIPLLLTLFVGLRYVIKFVVNELAVWFSGFLGETTGFNMSETTIVISAAVVFILLRIGFLYWNQKRKTS